MTKKQISWDELPYDLDELIALIVEEEWVGQTLIGDLIDEETQIIYTLKLKLELKADAIYN